MEVLFTPWRYDYLTSPRTDQPCIFCNANSTPDAASTLTLCRTDEVLVMLNRYPYTNGHLMIAPVQHEARLFESSETILCKLMKCTAEAQRILSETYHPDGFNIGMNFGASAGAGVADHYHIHVVPRWGGDANFMSVTAQTRMVPENLDSTYKKLQPKFEQMKTTFQRANA